MKYLEIQKNHRAGLKVKITQEQVNQYIKLTGDINSVHQGENAIVHGMLVSGFISTLIGTLIPGDGSIWISQEITFIRPIKVEEEISIIARVVDKDDKSMKVKLFIEVYSLGSQLMIMSTCWVKVPE